MLSNGVWCPLQSETIMFLRLIIKLFVKGLPVHNLTCSMTRLCPNKVRYILSYLDYLYFRTTKVEKACDSLFIKLQYASTFIILFLLEVLKRF